MSVTRRPEFTCPQEAWKVTSFIEPQYTPNARITSFYHSEFDYDHDLKWARERHGAGSAAELRVSPPGRYTQLRVPVTYPGGDVDFKCVMSDTPAEFDDHRDLIDHAHGRVLLNGLGLSCALSAVLATGRVTHVDVVERNADVIAMIAPYYRGYPVTIHHACAMSKPWTPGTRFDYVWSDIWTWITPDNLRSDTAEHGISYDMLMGRMASLTDRQGAWAHDLAVALRDQRAAVVTG